MPEDNTVHQSPIILIGPIGAGKSTVAQLLAEQLALPHHSLDALRWDYYAEIGYDKAVATEIAQSAEGMVGLLRYWKPFEIHAVERILDDHPTGVIDFGAGHSVYEESVLFARAQQALAPYPHVLLLLPSPDLDESATILNARLLQEAAAAGETVNPTLLEINRHFVLHPSNRQLAKLVIYTKDQTPAATCAEIIRQLNR